MAVLVIGFAHGLHHFAGNGEGVADAPRFQIRNRNVADGRAHAGELVEQGFTGGNHVRGGVTEPGPENAQREVAQVEIVPALQGGRGLLLARWGRGRRGQP